MLMPVLKAKNNPFDWHVRKKIWLASTHLLEAVGNALDEGVAAAAISDALLVRREIFAHGSGVVVVEGFDFGN